LQFRLADPAGNGGARAGLGACDGDSGGPVFERTGDRLQIVGVISWSTGAALSAGCGGLTGVTPLVRYRAWIENAAGTLGVTLTPPAR
jgi:secreted trypsin-like serine protease